MRLRASVGLACLFAGRVVSTLGILALAGCLVAPTPGPLRVVDQQPAQGGDHPSGAPIRIIFDGYLEPGLPWRRAAVLRSADVNASIDVGYDPSGPALVIVPRVAMRADLAYELVLDPAIVRGVDGRVLPAEYVLGFTARDAPSISADPIIFSRDLAPIFERKCGCHGPEPLAFPPLVPNAMIDVPSPADPALSLVTPGDPLRSMLLLKVLPDYPQVRGLAMPPEGPPLSGETLRKLVSWIEAGAEL